MNRAFDALDNPIFHALSTEHRALALGGDLALRYPPAIGPLAGLASPSPQSYEALRPLAGPGGVIVLFLTEAPNPPAGWTLLRTGTLHQMLWDLPSLPAGPGLPPKALLRPLTADDVPAMVALAELTEPGPFRSRTCELGAFFGIFADSGLAAMAGQRLHLPQSVEVSAVCTHPNARGRGYAPLVMTAVLEDIRARGKTPFLHTMADNLSAVRVYERLGFALHRSFHLAVLKSEH